jgi:hypothetical protein
LQKNTRLVKGLAHSLGFDFCGISKAIKLMMMPDGWSNGYSMEDMGKCLIWKDILT